MHKVILIGSPNSGKSLLFNRLTGLHQKVANFPGITVDVASGKLSHAPDLELVDYPGTYSLQAISGEEQVAVAQFTASLDDPSVSQVLCIIDVTRLEKSLYFTLQVIRECARHGKPVIVIGNMIDVLHRHAIEFDTAGLAVALGAPLLPISARSGEGLDTLLDQVRANADQQEAVTSGSQWSDTPDVRLRGTAHQLARQFGPRGDILVRTQSRLDSFFLHTGTGGLVFFSIMFLLFQSIFTWSAPVMDAIEMGLGALSDWIVPALPQQIMRDFTADAIFSGIGAFLVFVPQIFVLTVIIGILEDSG